MRVLDRRDAARRPDRIPHAGRFISTNRSVACISSINSCRRDARRASASLKFSTNRRNRDCARGAPISKVLGDIRYEDVSFSYAEGLPALNHISLHARPGETVALVGTTGAGKSTLVNLLTRFYELSSGEILIDGKPIRSLGVHALREMIGLVTQESFLFNGTIRENLLMGKPDASDEELLRAADAANARVFIDRLPDGLSSVVGERGVKLSVGEKQRLSIARALAEGSADFDSR